MISDFKYIPLAVGTKIPILKGWQQDNFTYDTEFYRKAWRGVKTGAISRLVIIDYDKTKASEETHALAKRISEHCKYIVRTPSGGYHYYFETDEDWKCGQSVNGYIGLDIRGWHGFGACPPTPGYILLTNNEPGPVPEWLRELLWTKPVELAPTADDSKHASPEILEHIEKLFLQCPPAVSGENGHVVTLLRCKHLTRHSALSNEQAWPILQKWNATCKPPWSNDELKHKLEDSRLGDDPRDLVNYLWRPDLKPVEVDPVVPDIPVSSQPMQSPVDVRLKTTMAPVLKSRVEFDRAFDTLLTATPSSDKTADIQVFFSAVGHLLSSANLTSVAIRETLVPRIHDRFPFLSTAAIKAELKAHTRIPTVIKPDNYVPPAATLSYLQTFLSGQGLQQIGIQRVRKNIRSLHPEFEFSDSKLEGKEMGPLYSILAARIGKIAIGETTEGKTKFLAFSSTIVEEALIAQASEDKFDPVIEYFNALPEWDGVDRLKQVENLGCVPSPMSSKYWRLTAIAAVARAFDPGCKVDTVLVLCGMGGAFKGSILKALNPFEDDYFCDDGPQFSSQNWKIDFLRNISSSGAFFVEWAELDTFKSRPDAVKAFITQQRGQIDEKYAHKQTVPRNWIMFGTTNDESLLEAFGDDNSDRRFFMVKQLDPKDQPNAKLWITKNKHQWWAQAVYLYRAAAKCVACRDGSINLTGRCVEHRWWLTHEEQAAQREENSHFKGGEQLEETIVDFLSKWHEINPEKPISITKDLESFLQKIGGVTYKGNRNQIGRIMRKLGYIEHKSHGTMVWKKGDIN